MPTVEGVDHRHLVKPGAVGGDRGRVGQQGDPPAGQVTAFFEKTVTVEGVQYRQPWTSVSWSIGAQKTVTVAGRTLTYAEVMQLVPAIAAQEKAAKDNPPPAPPANP